METKIRQLTVTPAVRGWPLTMADLSPRARQLWEPLLPTLVRRGIVLLGRAGVGKTPLAKTLAAAASRAALARMAGEDGTKAGRIHVFTRPWPMAVSY